MRSIKPVTLVLVIGAFTLSAFGDRFGSPTSTPDGVASAHTSEGGAAAGGEEGRASASGVHISRATVQRINELLRLNGIPVVLSTSDPITQRSQHGVAVCFASGRDALIIAGPVGDN